jgi:SulP family sulfate permease
MYFGLTFMLRWVVDAREELPLMDYVIVLLILGVIFAVGFLPGIGLGIVLAVILFVVNYSRINVIKHALSGANHQSTVERPELYRDLLRKKGHWLYMVKLQGFIFFGTANSLFNQFRERIEDHEQQRPRYFLLDFHQVTGVDSSAMLSFQKMLQYARQQNVVILFTALSPVMEGRLAHEPFASEQGKQWRKFPDLDHGMEWYEDQVIADFESVGFGIKPPTMTRRLVKVLDSRKSADAMMSYLQRIEMDDGDVVLEQGDPPCGMYFIEEGQVTVQLHLHHDRWIRIRTMSSGTVIGELSYYLDIPATARVVTEGKAVLFFLSIEKLNEMGQKNPEISTAFHKFMANTIAERLVSANDTMKVLLD